jgi:membrane protease YdiL (CAAX protease family)
LLVTGLVLGYLRQRTGSITAPIVAHTVNNLVGVIGLLTGL